MPAAHPAWQAAHCYHIYRARGGKVKAKKRADDLAADANLIDKSGGLKTLIAASDTPHVAVTAVTVADVLESMASARPYRHALGVDAALDELLRGRGDRQRTREFLARGAPVRGRQQLRQAEPVVPEDVRPR